VHIGALIIGDEIMSGKRQDKHFAHVIEALGNRGLELNWCQYLGDDAALITETLRRTLGGNDLVFCFGGIGATPDDYTRACAARAAGVDLVRHPDAAAEIEAQFGAEAYPIRIVMADLPAGSRIVPNSYNRIPGFSLSHHHFLPGFPQMAWPMLEWVLDRHYPDLRNDTPDVEAAIVVNDVVESQLMSVMEEIVRRFPEVRFASLPHFGEDGSRHIELSVRGRPDKVPPAAAYLKQAVSALGHEWQEP
jgi:molybdopterin-biosynthesis enzyme MoeA-like protein